MKKIFAICGSTKKESFNLNLIKFIAKISEKDFSIDIFEGIDILPHYNPDIDYTDPPATVLNFRQRMRAADAVLICTPEYAMGVPGSLKNSIDWVVSSCELSRKPTALITASTVGHKGHAALMETLNILECAIPEEVQLLIPFIKTKINTEGEVTDPATLESLHALMKSLQQVIDNSVIEHQPNNV